MLRVRVSTPAYSGWCPTGPEELSELFLVRWTMAGAKRHPSHEPLLDKVDTRDSTKQSKEHCMGNQKENANAPKRDNGQEVR
ncbi:hypothetical protein Tco_0781593 [Tanacetum coccineum]